MQPSRFPSYDEGMPADLPTVTGCGNSFSNSTAADAAATSSDNVHTFGADLAGLVLACGDRIFFDGFGSP